MDDEDSLEPTIAMPRIAPPHETVVPHPDEAVAPEPTPLEPTPAPVSPPVYVFGNPFGYVIRRFLAFAVDAVLVTGVATTLLYGFIAINPFTGMPNSNEGGFDTTFGLGFAVTVVYFWIFEAFFGTTLGKLAFSLHVYSRNRRFVGLGRAFIRNLLRPIDALVIGWILALLPGHRRLGDLLGATVVARSPLRAFSPLVGWIGIIALAALPFIIAGGPVAVLAAGAAFLDFVPRLVEHVFEFVMQLLGGSAPATPPPASTSA